MTLKHFILAATLLLAACAAPGVREVQQPSDLPRLQELTATPFFPQKLYQCGPASLATVLTANELPADPEKLTAEVYIPSRQGSLQIEMLAAARRHGAVPVLVAPKLDALFREVAGGHSVLVLQNLGLSWYPVWHYAVVIGYDLDAGEIWLRSGTTKRQSLSISTFERTWARGGHWGFVALKPGELPADKDPENMTRALLAFEKTAPAAKSKKAYSAAVQRWPDNLVLLMGWGNTAYADKDYASATNAFRKAATAHPKSAAARNNLATALLAQGLVEEARTNAEQALELAGDDAKMKQQVMQTLREISAKTSRKVKSQ